MSVMVVGIKTESANGIFQLVEGLSAKRMVARSFLVDVVVIVRGGRVIAPMGTATVAHFGSDCVWSQQAKIVAHKLVGFKQGRSFQPKEISR